MKILVLGGTRFIGRALVERLLAAGHRVTVASRRVENAPVGAETVGGERKTLLAKLRHRVFDATMDFICYDRDGPDHVLEAMQPGLYVVVSSTWISRLHNPRAPLLEVTRRYLEGKSGAEDAVSRLRAGGRAATVLRLPMVWGERDHTGRLDFYRRRIRTDRQVIAVDGGKNRAQIAWRDDVARVIATWLDRAGGERQPLWEALSDDGETVRAIIAEIAAAEDVKARLLTVSSANLARDFPGYLIDEPLWRETTVPVSEANLYAATGEKPTPRATWLAKLAQLPLDGDELGLMRAERAYLAGLGHA